MVEKTTVLTWDDQREYLRGALRYHAEIWTAKHDGEVKGRIHWHGCDVGDGWKRLRFHLLRPGRHDLWVDIFLDQRIASNAMSLIDLGKIVSATLHRALFRTDGGCVVCSPDETALKLGALRR